MHLNFKLPLCKAAKFIAQQITILILQRINLHETQFILMIVPNVLFYFLMKVAIYLALYLSMQRNWALLRTILMKWIWARVPALLMLLMAYSLIIIVNRTKSKFKPKRIARTINVPATAFLILKNPSNRIKPIIWIVLMLKPLNSFFKLTMLLHLVSTC